jgi:KDO2-lipid IV(A) lauroyltransferase
VRPLTRLRRAVRAQILAALFWCCGRLPLGTALRFGDWLGRLVFWAAPGERHKALAHLAIAFPEKSDSERLTIARQSFAQLGVAALELTQLRKIDVKRYVSWPQDQIDALREALAPGNGGVLVFGHIGNWELIGPRMVAEGFGGVAVGRDSGDPYLARRIERFRRSLGVPVVGRGSTSRQEAPARRPGATSEPGEPRPGLGATSEPGEPRPGLGATSSSLKEILRALRGGKLVAVLIDQDTRVDSVFVPFFGQLARTPKAAEDLARLSKGCCVLAFIHRRPDGGHAMRTEIVDPRASDLTARLTRRIEDELRAQPSDWVWMHERWKRRPE